MKRRDLVAALEKAGFRFVRNNRHSIYQKSNGGRAVQVPNHREIDERLARKILQDAGLV